MISKLKLKIKNMSENNRIVAGNVIGAFAVKGLSLFVSLFTMPAYMAFFNNETALGLWFTVLSVISWILNFDLGIGNGLRNHLTRSLTEKNETEAKRYISSAYVIIGLVCAIVTVTFLLIFRFVNWNIVFNIKDSIVSEKALLLTVQISFFGIMLQLFFKLIQSVLYATQRSSVNNLLILISSVLTLLAVSVLPSETNDSNMIMMAIIHLAAVLLPLFVATVVVFSGKKMRKVRPSFKFVDKKHITDVIGLGGIFFLVQVMYMLTTATSEYLVSVLSSNDSVVTFRIYNQLFTLGSTVFALALTPIWSVVTKAIAEKNILWVDKLYKRLLKLLGLGVLLEFAIVPVLQLAVNIWLRDKAITVNYIYGLIFAVFGSMIMFVSVITNIVNGLGKLKIQAIFYTLAVILKITLSVVFVRSLDSWIGVQLAGIIALLPFCIIQPIWLHRYLRNLPIKVKSKFEEK